LTQLKNLNLDGCSLLTDAGLEHLKGLTELKYLELKKCPNITGAGIDLLQKSLPDCKISAEPKNTSSMNNSNSSNGKTSTTETNSQSDSKKSSLNQSKELKAPKPTTSVEDAIGQKDYVTLSKLIALKPSIVTEKDVYKGNTLLHRSAYNVDLVKCLVENGADVHAKDRSGRTPIFYAVINEEQDVVEYLLQHGEQINVKDKENRTPLFCAAELEKKTLAEFLINKGADINAKDIYENNLLHHVVLKRVVKYNTRNRSQLEMLEFLKEKGTDINAKNKYGQLPFDMIEIKVEPDLVGSFFDHSPQNKTTADPRMKKVVDEIKSLLRPTGTTKGQL
jgi:ankyrin repeat protein